jgi:hypothetical protein
MIRPDLCLVDTNLVAKTVRVRVPSLVRRLRNTSIVATPHGTWCNARIGRPSDDINNRHGTGRDPGRLTARVVSYWFGGQVVGPHREGLDQPPRWLRKQSLQ